MTEATTGPALSAADLPLEPEDFGAGTFGEGTGESEPFDEEQAQIQTDLDPQAQEDFIGLARLGYLEDECEIAGHEFVLKTPWHDDRLERGLLHKPSIGSTNFEPMWELLSVAAYLHEIDGVPAPEPLNSRDGAVKTRLDWVKRSIFSQIVIRKLYAKTVELDARERAVVEYVDGQSKS